MTPLHVAASHGWVTISKCLIESGANIRSLDEEQMTPLHFACMEGNLEIAKLLFDAGSSFVLTVHDFYCCYYTSWNVLCVFFAAEQEGGWTTVSKMVTDQDREEETALHLAVEAGHPDVAKLCLDKGANVNAVKVGRRMHCTILVSRSFLVSLSNNTHL